MQKRKPLANTTLARWLDDHMADYLDSDTGRRTISQRQLATQAKVPQAIVSDVLIKGHTPKPDFLNRLAEFFGVSPMRLYYLAYLPKEHTEEFEFWSSFFRLHKRF